MLPFLPDEGSISEPPHMPVTHPTSNPSMAQVSQELCWNTTACITERFVACKQAVEVYAVNTTAKPQHLQALL